MQLKRKKEIKILITGEFPGGPVVKDPPSNAEVGWGVGGARETVITLAYSLIRRQKILQT